MKNPSIGKLLADKNALINYIYEDDTRIGVVVGMKGKDRDTPLVGWALYEDFDDYECDYINKSIENTEWLTKSVLDIDTILWHNPNDTSKEIVNARNAFNKIVKLKVQTRVNHIDNSFKYRAVELALLRANSNRDNFFVCTNPAYGQCSSNLNPQTDYCKLQLRNGSIRYDENLMITVRQASRAMEYRCWRYFTNQEEADDNN